MEVEALQESSSKLNEDRIFELKQRIEDLLMENDTLSGQGQTLKREVTSLRYVCTIIPVAINGGKLSGGAAVTVCVSPISCYVKDIAICLIT